MVKRKWLWGKKSCEKIAGETESSGSMSSQSDKILEDQEPIKGSPNNSHSPEVNSKATESIINREETDKGEKSLTRKLSDDTEEDRPNDRLSEEDAYVISMNGDTRPLAPDCCVEDISKGSVSNENVPSVSVEDSQGVKFGKLSSNGCLEDKDSFKLLTEKLSAALVNVSHKDELVKQHSKVAEEAVAGWEKAEKEADSLKQQLEAVAQKKSSLEDRVSQLDEALKECVRQLRLARDEQEKKINQAVTERTSELELAKTRLEDQLVELQALLETSRMNDLELQHRTDFLEEENVVLRQELQSLSEELEVRTIERDLSTKAAETASKQHLESIKKLARLEAECRKLKSLSRVTSISNERKSSTAVASCAESLTDSQSDGAEQLSASECDGRKMNGSWASALIAELDQFTSEKVDRNMNPPSTDINLMDDFLEMERLASLPSNGPQVQSVGCDETLEKSAHKEDSSLRIELESMARRTAELEENICKVEAEKAELAITLAQAQSCFEESQVQLIETQMKLEQLDRQLHDANEGERFYKALFIQFEREANLMSSQIKSLRAEIEKEQALSKQISVRCKDLENELRKKEEELEFQQEEMFSDELKLKETDLAQTQDSLEKSEAQLKQAEKKLKELEKKLQVAYEEKKSLNSELDSVRQELQRMSIQIESLNEQARKGLMTENVQMELEKELLEANEEKISLNIELDFIRAELQTMSSQIELLNQQAQKGLMTENVQMELEKGLQEANEEKKSLHTELDCMRAELQTMSSQIELLNEQAQSGLMTENVQLEKELQEANEEKKSLNSELDCMRAELQTMSSQIESLNEQVQKGLLNEQEKKELEKELQQANEEKKSLNSVLDGMREELQTMSSQIELSNEQVQNELEKELQQVNEEKKALNSELDGMREQLQTMSAQIELLKEQVQKEKALVAELSTKYEEMEYELQKKTQEINVQQRAHSNNELKIKQEDLAVAAGKLADCQQTIASLGSQLKSLATLEDFLIDPASIPGFSAPAPLMARRSTGEPWKLHSNDTYLNEKEYEPLRNTQEDLSPFATHNRRDARG
uniref:Uncharacterized protein n=2 Tax=Chenopodium quinoa TaxID=63459 RepID=A0A803LK39_CHEQI